MSERAARSSIRKRIAIGICLSASRPPLLAEQFRQLIRHSELIHSRLDVLCRFVLVMRGIAKDPYDEITAQLGISRTAAQQAYHLAFQLIDNLTRERLGDAWVATVQLKGETR